MRQPYQHTIAIDNSARIQTFLNTHLSLENADYIYNKNRIPKRGNSLLWTILRNNGTFQHFKWTNKRTYDEWISEHWWFDSAVILAALCTQWESVRPKTDAVHGVRREHASLFPLTHSFCVRLPLKWHIHSHQNFQHSSISIKQVSGE